MDKKNLTRSASTDSDAMARSMKKKKPKERWLLTRKTWRYMADAGRKLIPDGAQNRPEDLSKIEDHFQEICKKEPRFLLWRKNSYPGAMGFRKKRKGIRPGGSCRKAFSADDVVLKPERPRDLPLLTHKYNIQKMREDFLNTPTPTTDYLPTPSPSPNQEEQERQLVNMLERYLKLSEASPSTTSHAPDFNYQDLVDKLQRLLASSRTYVSTPTHFTEHQVRFSGDHVQKSLSETLSRYFSQSTNRDRVISDLLTDRKALEKLYFELRKAKGFRASRGGSGYTSTHPYTTTRTSTNTTTTTPASYREKLWNDQNQKPPPLIEIESETFEISYHDWGVQTIAIPEATLHEIEKEYKKILKEQQQQEEDSRDNKPSRRRSSVDNDDISQSVSDTIKRYLRMARKKSVDTDKVDRFKRVNYDRNLRNIKAKGEITKPGDDDGLNKGCQTNDDWILKYRDLKFDEISDVESRVSSSRSSIDGGVVDHSNPGSPPSKSHSFLSQLLHKHHDKSGTSPVASAGTMQKSKSSSSVMHHGSRLMAKKIFRTRSKSQTRPAQACSWTPQGGCVWTNITGRQVVLNDTTLLQLTEIERKILQKVALAKLQALNLGVQVKVPTECVGAAAATKPKRRPYLLKRKALTTSIFDASRKDGEKEGASPSTGGLVFGIPLTQCVENDRLSRAAAGTSRTELSGDEQAVTIGRHGSRSSFSSLIEPPRTDESGSCENLMLRERIVGSVPGLLDSLSCGSTADFRGITLEEEPSVPNILNICFRHLEQHGLHTLGIFRVSTSKKRIRQLREDFDCGKETTLEDEQCPHDVATLLKEYLRDLPDPLLCRDLYHAFVQTQRIRNRRLQFEALQHLIQLLPAANRDTLYALLSFLAAVAKNAPDAQSATGEVIPGNKMDSNNLATVFAPNVLHCIKPGAKDSSSQDRPEDRIDIINVVRTLIDHYKQLYAVSAELLDEIYLHMMDSHPEALDNLLNKKDAIAAADESVDELDSESYSAPWTPTAPTSEMSIETVLLNEEPKRTYSREEFLHEAAATGGPNVGMRVRHKDRIRERSTRRRHEESSTRRKREEEGIGGAITTNIMSKTVGPKDEEFYYNKNRSSSIESTSSTHTDDMNKVLRIEDERRKSSPYILDNSGVITASLTIPVQTNQGGLSVNLDDIPYIEDAERQQLTIGVVRTPIPTRRRQRSISSDSSNASNVQPITGSMVIQTGGYDSAVGSTTYSSTVQNTPTSDAVYSSPPSWASSPPTSPDSVHTSVNYIPEDKLKVTVAKVSFTETKQEIPKSKSMANFEPREVRETRDIREGRDVKEKVTPSITSIGNAVLRSRTADFERISKESITKKAPSSEKKKYTKRRYTDSRHQTGHIPDSKTLESSTTKKETVTSNQAPVYKRRELISSVPTK